MTFPESIDTKLQRALVILFSCSLIHWSASFFISSKNAFSSVWKEFESNLCWTEINHFFWPSQSNFISKSNIVLGLIDEYKGNGESLKSLSLFLIAV